MYPPESPTQPRLSLGSPQKLQDRQRTALIPSSKATRAALVSLSAFLVSNSPISLAAALPRYDDAEWPLNKEDLQNELTNSQTLPSEIATKILDEDSFLHCLRENFIQRPESRHLAEDDWEREDLQPVANSSWSVLEWFVSLAEKDQLLSMQSKQGCYSKVLLYQFPKAKTGSGPRWDLSGVLSVLFACFHSPRTATSLELERRVDIGSRLLDMIINLAKAKAVSDQHLTRELCNKLNAILPQEVNRLLEAIQPADFRVTLCFHYLSSLMNEGKDSVDKGRPKPRARGQVAHETQSKSPAANSTAASEQSTHLPSADQVLTLLITSKSDETEPDLRVTCIKYHLLAAYGQSREREPAQDWTEILNAGVVKSLLSQAFPPANNANNTCGELNFLARAQALLNLWDMQNS